MTTQIIQIVVAAIVILILAIVARKPFYEARDQCLSQGYIDGGIDEVHGQYCIEKICETTLIDIDDKKSRCILKTINPVTGKPIGGVI